jgi:hypothetical protein
MQNFIKKRLILRRFCAIVFDLILLKLASDSLSFFFSGAGNAALLGCFVGPLIAFKTTCGGIIFGLQTSPLKNQKPLGSIQAISRLLFLGFIFSGCSIILVLTNNLLLVLIIVGVDLAPLFLTKDRLMLHDIITRSYVKIDDRNNFSKKDKLSILLVFAALFLTVISILIYSSKQFEKCELLYHSGNYQETLDECENLSDKVFNPKLSLISGKAAYELGLYDVASEKFVKSEILGEFRASYFLVMIELEKQNHLKTLLNSELDQANPIATFLASGTYLEQYEKNKQAKNLINSYAYSKLTLRIFDNKMSQNHILESSLSKRQVLNSDRAIEALAKKYLNKEEFEEAQKLSEQL